ncbi:MAG: hypothetical protein COV31_01035 [Candidatus Yanofskybacteria bacterium CG10_big_fil_rev_8_21_14_0_10_46_23]|uniref:DNA polymerase III subunit gamma/tau n=1 Tax=Candidatus Yanofskybacteria bacterium CG10_big_fil_rev_8_21_14_0_10_46_23 TaxID=1975098 RepID=A0A2H0R4I9_9BACT|nr:MAG: hypothetical protein COV31_01035 [Candidatus Yanofskybacteria bacterium CG10_big_fil_rev_8_21_14_0_10_46_23]
MAETLYRKYRPARFKDIRGQEHVTRTLRGALMLDRVAHAYLFAGPRGTGKTTIARIFAKALNCENLKEGEPCDKCSTCQAINESRSVDIIEIDGASNRGIDEIRNIKEIARVASSQNRFKVFIIDEVHSLTKDAFNALLKTLEEPPAHVKFILATTEPHKLLPTVLSRVQRFDFKKLSLAEIIDKLKHIVRSEKISAETDIFHIIATNAEGSLRDAESSLAKLISVSGTAITLDQAKDILGFIPTDQYAKALDLILAKDQSGGIKMINDLYVSGVDLSLFTDGLINFSRKIIIAKAVDSPKESLGDEFLDDHLQYVEKIANTVESADLIKIINRLIQVRHDLKTSPIPQLPLELAIMDLAI